MVKMFDTERCFIHWMVFFKKQTGANCFENTSFWEIHLSGKSAVRARKGVKRCHDEPTETFAVPNQLSELRLWPRSNGISGS